ncbi:MAG TPA: RsmD family RNA methyltransferase [Gemmatimonadaceae bacterium]
MADQSSRQHGVHVRQVPGVPPFDLRGRALTSLNDFRLRPAAEHVCAALLDILGSDLKDASVLDLFAGTGALGLEALSRGARRCDFVETRPACTR